MTLFFEHDGSTDGLCLIFLGWRCSHVAESITLYYSARSATAGQNAPLSLMPIMVTNTIAVSPWGDRG